ncbi:VCBS repeat-containing protein [Paenibacillus sp. NEAU-GSW1]|uniref:VCBS repeat-containing protein n=1 Tax=Paenibacillus sp. NEAU-GSW1 TaxID=2682486 RepID=UPI0012E30728|nr:VCBS repeat-containing protein [Paenibacillus sp. NEAU-GSW1]MUT65640.1 hypothetical protein [Paenibacillus sp. NEAU-GSW1]
MIIGKLFKAALTAAFLCMFAAGCSFTAAPAELLTKPKLTDERQALMKAVDEARPQYSKLTLPLKDDGQGAVRQVDLNGDGSPEAIVTLFNEYSVPELMVFRKISGSWRSWFIVEQPMARQIDWIKIDDFDGNGKAELAVGWVGSFESPNLAEFYSFQTKPIRNEEGKLVLQPIESMPYLIAETGDVNADGKLDIAIIETDAANPDVVLPSYTLKVYDWRDRGLSLLQQTKLFEGVNMYDRMLIGRVSKQNTGIVVEASTGAHAMYTGMYAWVNGGLKQVYPQVKLIAAPSESGISERPSLSGDIDGDGIIELVNPVAAPGSNDLSYAETYWINIWEQWDGGERFVNVMEEYSDYSYRVQLTIPEQWKNHYTISAPSSSDSYAIANIEYWNGQKEYKAPFAVIYAVPLQKREQTESAWKEQSKGYVALAADNGVLYALSYRNPPVTLAKDDLDLFNSMQLEDEEISVLFHRIEDQ